MANTSKTKLDQIFSEFIRLRDVGANGYGMCISCGKIIYWKDGDAGHFINRQHMSTRYCEKNVNLQCRYCNRFDEGCNVGYIAGLKKKYGESIIDELTVKKHTSVNIGSFEIDAFYKHYLSLVNQMKKEKK